jgi:hypothetical protein
MKDIYTNGTFDIKPNWLDWSINGYANACPIDVLSNGEKLNSFDWYTRSMPVQLKNIGTFRHEITESARLLTQLSQGNRISVCLSGRDSEVICAALNDIGADFDMWYANYWTNGTDTEMMALLNACQKLYNRELHVVNIDQQSFEDCVFDFACRVGICEPALSGLTHMIRQIPENNFIVMGDGDIAKNHLRYDSLYNPKRLPAHAAAVKQNTDSVILPFIPDEVMLRIWSQLEGRHRIMSCFHHCRMEIWASATLSAGFCYDRTTGDISINDLYITQFPGLIFKHKTDQFKHPVKGKYKNAQRSLLRSVYGDLYNEQDVGSCYRIDQLWTL